MYRFYNIDDNEAATVVFRAKPGCKHDAFTTVNSRVTQHLRLITKDSDLL